MANQRPIARSIWSAATCRRFGRAADGPARQSRVRRLGVTTELFLAFDGDRSPAESADKSAHFPKAAAFSLTELLVVVAILTLLAATQLPALTCGKVPVKFTQCMNNLRQMGRAVMVYKDDNNDAYPFGKRVFGPGTSAGSVVDPMGWPMQLLRYLGGYHTNVQPMVYVCPSEQGTAAGWVYQEHYVANRMLLSTLGDIETPILGAMVRTPNIYWMFIEKSPADICNIRPGGLANPILAAWNYPPGSPGMRRHNNGMNSVAADGHVEWLRMPLYQPGAPAPPNFVELGDCANGINSPATWANNGPRAKLFCRYAYVQAGENPF
jgi:prepilin-type processing-associated H-X9-DG protein